MGIFKSFFAITHELLTPIQVVTAGYALGRTFKLLPSEKVANQLSRLGDFISTNCGNAGTNVVNYLKDNDTHYANNRQTVNDYYPNWEHVNKTIGDGRGFMQLFFKDFWKNCGTNGTAAAAELMFSKSIFGQTTHFGLIPFVAAVVDRDMEMNNSMELTAATLGILFIELGYWATQNSNDTPCEHCGH